MRFLRCAIDKVCDWHPQLFLEPHVVASVAILSRYSKSPAAIDVECLPIDALGTRGDKQQRLVVSWSEQLEKQANRLRRTIQQKQLVEMAALALAFLVAYRLLKLKEWDVTRYGERVDYRSPKHHIALEVSGTESSREFERRHRDKVRQALANPWDYHALVVICGFFATQHRIRMSYHPFDSFTP